MRRKYYKLRKWIITAVTALIIGSAFAQTANYNPLYHYYPSIDPTGLFWFDGQYYLNWGSAKSNDLVHWQMTDYGRARNNRTASTPQVITGISGTAVIDINNTSGLGKNGVPPIVAFQFQNRSTAIAYSLDTAKTWVQYEKPAVLPNATGTFRDPKVFWYEPDQKWILVLPWCEIQEIRFFSSKNLIDWEYMSKFGPWGATAGQWECVEFFPLSVDNDQSKTKWVLIISLQPRNGQYFVGEFDGKRFTMDDAFLKELTYDKYIPQGIMVFDFEKGIDQWKIEGNAFLDCPTVAEGTNGKQGSRSIKSSGAGTGKLTSPAFTITKNFINLMVGGGNFPGQECVNLLVDGKVVRTHTGNNGNAHLNWKGWDVTEFMGKSAQIEIVDNMTESSMATKGYIYCDAVMLCDALPKTPYKEFNPGWEKAFWVDYGSDFFAVRAWANLAPGDKRTIWAGWMGSWRYYNEPVYGIYSVLRSLELKTFPEGIRLIQNPIREMESLRTTNRKADEYTFTGTWKPKKFVPVKNSYELIVEFENVSAQEFGLNLCVGENEKTVVGYRVNEEEIYVDRNNSGYDDFNPVFPSVHAGPLKNRTNTVKLHIFVDKCSVEVFGNNGETVLSTKIYPGESSLGIELFSNHGQVKVKSLQMWDLASIDLK